MLREISLVLLMVAVAVRGLPEIDKTLCDGVTAVEYHCGSCLQPYACGTTGNLIELPKCTEGTVCEEVSTNAAQCVPIASASVCKCVSDICDTHNPMYSAKCDADGIITDIEDCTGAQTNPSSGACVSGSCVDCDGYGIIEPEYFVVPPKCSVGYQCNNGEFVNTHSVVCPEGQYVSKAGICTDAPPKPCDSANLCSISEQCADLTNCNQYYYCGSDGTPNGPFQCAPTYYFDPVTHFCLQGDSRVCDPWTQCSFT